MADIKEVCDVVWSDIYYDQAASFIDYLLDGRIRVPWCSEAKLRDMKSRLRNMAKMDSNENVWDYGERSVRLSLPGDVESGIYRLMSEYDKYGFSFDMASSLYSDGLLDWHRTAADIEAAEELSRGFKRDRMRMKRRNRENTAAACLERYIADCRGTGVEPTMEGYVAACGSRRLGRRIWRKYMM